MVEDYVRCLNDLNTRGKQQRWKGGRKKKMCGRNEKSVRPDVHNAVEDDKGYGDSSSSLRLELWLTIRGTHCQRKGSHSQSSRKVAVIFSFQDVTFLWICP